MPPSTQGNVFLNLLPLLLIYTFLVIIMTPIAKRKGKKVWLNGVMCFIPIANAFWILSVLSLTDEAVKNELAELRQAVNELKQAK